MQLGLNEGRRTWRALALVSQWPSNQTRPTVQTRIRHTRLIGRFTVRTRILRATGTSEIK